MRVDSTSAQFRCHFICLVRAVPHTHSQRGGFDGLGVPNYLNVTVEVCEEGGRLLEWRYGILRPMKWERVSGWN